MTQSKKKHPGRGRDRDAVAAREQRFAEVYMGNGENGKRAYMEVYGTEGENTATVQASKLLRKPNVIEYLRQRRAEIRAKYALTAERLYQEVARLAYYDPGKLFDARGQPLPVHEIDADTRAAIAALEIEVVDGRMTYRMRPHDKNAALDKALRLLRLYDAPPPPPPDEGGQAIIDDRDLARRIAFWLNKAAHAKRLEHKPESA